MLYIVGLGLEEGDLTLKGLKALTDADERFLENYTSLPYEPGFPYKLLKREQIESDFLLKRALNKNVVLLIPGDPLFATTHISLVADCRKAGIDVEVIHAPSVINALSRTGLSPYKFGRIVTLPGDKKDHARIEQNRGAGLHSLCLIDPALTAQDGLLALERMGVTQLILACERLAMHGEKIHYGPITELAELKFGPGPHCLIVPASLHFFEEEFLQQFTSSKPRRKRK